MEHSPVMISDKKKKMLNLEGYQRHIIFCGGDTCCSAEVGEPLWDHLKSRLKDLGLTDKGTARVYRTKAKCLRVCADGPIAVVYPEGTWYRFLDRAALDKVIDQHLLGGEPVSDFAFAKNSMMNSSKNCTD